MMKMDLRKHFRRFERFYFRTSLSRIFAELMSRNATHLYTRGISDVGPLPKGSRIADIGCGHGTFLCMYLKKYDGIYGTGIDQSRTLISFAQKQARQRNVPANFQVGDAHDLPFGRNRFDVIVSHSSIYCWHHPVKALNGLYEVLKTGGRLLIYDELPVRSLKGAIQALFDQQLYGLGLPAYTEDELEGFVKRSRFQSAEKTVEKFIIRLTMVK